MQKRQKSLADEFMGLVLVELNTLTPYGMKNKYVYLFDSFL